MGCSGLLSLFRRKTGETEQNKEYGPRPAHDSIVSGNSAFSEFEKPYIGQDGRQQVRPPPHAHVGNLRPNVNPQFSAYAGVANREEHNSSNYYNPQYRGGGASSYRPGDSRDNWTGSQVSTQVSSRQSDQYVSKLKDEGGIDDPEELARRKKAEEIRRKAEQEEQERLDFFQMM